MVFRRRYSWPPTVPRTRPTRRNLRSTSRRRAASSCAKRAKVVVTPAAPGSIAVGTLRARSTFLAERQVALAGVFGVEPSYLLDRGEPLFDRELVEALRNRTVREATREISRLPKKERRLVLGIVRQFGSENNTRSRQNAGGTAWSARVGVHPHP